MDGLHVPCHLCHHRPGTCHLQGGDILSQDSSEDTTLETSQSPAQDPRVGDIAGEFGDSAVGVAPERLVWRHVCHPLPA